MARLTEGSNTYKGNKQKNIEAIIYFTIQRISPVTKNLAYVQSRMGQFTGTPFFWFLNFSNSFNPFSLSPKNLTVLFSHTHCNPYLLFFYPQNKLVNSSEETKSIMIFFA